MAVKVLIVGANGFIGSSISLKMIESNFDVYPTSRKNLKLYEDFKTLDIFNRSTWDILKNEIKPNIVVCTAWETEHNLYWEKQTNFDYMNATKKFATYCFENEVEKFICVGSMSEYGFSPGKCNAQITQVNPQDPYSEAKVLMSIALEEIAKKFGKKANWVRLFQPYGPNEKVERLIPTMIRNMYKNIPVEIKFPEHRLDFTHTEDIARAFVKITASDYEYSINLGTGTSTSVRELAIILSEKMQYYKKNLKFCTPVHNKDRLIFVDPESKIFFNDLKPTIDIKTGLDKMIT